MQPIEIILFLEEIPWRLPLASRPKSFLKFLMHPASWRPGFSAFFVSLEFRPPFWEKDSLGLGLDAPEDGISQEVLGSPQGSIRWITYSNMNITLLECGTTTLAGCKSFNLKSSKTDKWLPYPAVVGFENSCFSSLANWDNHLFKPIWNLNFANYSSPILL